MNISNLAIRLLTLAAYLLPSVFYLSTCTAPLSIESAFNPEQAIINEESKIKYNLALLDTLFQESNSNNNPEVLAARKDYMHTVFNESDNLSNLKYDQDNPQYRLIFPTQYSISGVGVMWLHKNLLSKILMAISLALSFLLVVHWRFLESRKVAHYFIIANIIVLLGFIIACFISSVTMCFGTWTLLFLLTIQLMTEYQSRRNSTEEKTEL